MGLNITWYQFSNALFSFPLAQVERISMCSFVWQPSLCQGWVDSWHKVGKVYWLVGKIYLFKWWLQLVFTAPKAWKLLLRLRLRPYQALIFFNESWNIMIRDGKQRSFANFSSDWKYRWMIGYSTKDWKKYKVYKRLEAVEKLQRLSEVQRSERLDLQVYCKVISLPTVLNLFCCTYNVRHAQIFTKESNLNMVQIT